MRKLVTVTTLSLALATASGAVPYNMADRVFPAYVVGPGLNDLSAKNGRAPHQRVLKSDGQAQKVAQKLSIDSLDPACVHRNKRGKVDAIAFPPLGPANILTNIINVVPGIDIDAQPAWQAYSQIGPKHPLTMAVIDASVNISYPGLQSSIQVNEDETLGDGIDNDSNGFVGDINGWNFYSNTNQIYEGPEDVHGIHAADTVAVSKDNGDIVGIADNDHAKIIPVKVLGGEDEEGSPENVIAAIKYAEANGAQTCNLSFGSQGCIEKFRAMIRNSGMLFTVAAGDGDDNAVGCNIDVSPICPASFPFDNVITVTNLMFDDTLDASSSFGAISVDIAAPGTFILDITPDNGYTLMSDTPMAAPMVTDAVVMLYTSRSKLSLPDIRNVILASVRETDSLNDKVLCDGMVDTNEAIHRDRQ